MLTPQKSLPRTSFSSSAPLPPGDDHPVISFDSATGFQLRMATATETETAPTKGRCPSSKNSKNKKSSKETKQPSGETSSENNTTTTAHPDSALLQEKQQQQQQQQPISSLLSRSRRSAASTIISPQTRGNAIALALASPSDLPRENNLVNNNAAASREAGRRHVQNKFISPSKRSTAEATLHFLARRRTVATRSSVGTVDSDTEIRRQQTQAASAAATSTTTTINNTHTTLSSLSSSSSLTTPGGRRRKRKAACDAQSKVRDICEMEDFDHLDELLTDSSQKISYNKSSSLAMNQGGRRKRTRRGGSTATTAGAVVSNIEVVADRRSSATLPSLSGMKKNHVDKHNILAVPVNNDTIDTAAAAASSSFVPRGKVEERWFRNFQKWRSISANTATNASAISTPTSPPPKLWIREQRIQYNLWKQNKKTQMTKERIHLLESAGFCWEVIERRENGKGDADFDAAALMSREKKTNDTISNTNSSVNDRNSKGRAMSEDAHESAEENRGRHLDMRKSPRKVLSTQFYLNLGEGRSDSIEESQSQLRRGLTESTAETPAPKTTPPKMNRKRERRGRHSMSALEALDVPEDLSLSSVGKGGKAKTKRPTSLSYKELDMAVSKSVKQKTRKKTTVKKPTEEKIEDKPHDQLKVDCKAATEISHDASVPLINCSDLSPSLESPLLVTTRLPTSSSSNDPQSLPATSTATNTPESLCVRKLMLSCLSDETSPDGCGTNSDRSKNDHPKPSNACNINDENSSTISMNSKVGNETSKRIMDESALVHREMDARSSGDALQSHPDSPLPVTRHEPNLPDHSTNIDLGSRSNPRQPTTPCDDTLAGSPWEHDVGDVAYTTEPSDVDLLPYSPESNSVNNPRRLFSSPVGNGEQSQTLSPTVNKSTRKDSGTQTAGFSSQVVVARKYGNMNLSPIADVDRVENSLRVYPPSSSTPPVLNDQQTQTVTLHDSAANTNCEESDTKIANPSSRSLDSSDVASHRNGNLGADLPVAFETMGPDLPVVVAERQYQASMTNYGQLEIEMRLVTQRMREIEERMKLVDSSLMPNNGIDSESYRSNSRSRSRRNSHHSSSNYYESSEEEYNSDEFYPPSPVRQRRSSGYLGPKEITGRSSRRTDSQKRSSRKGRSISTHDDHRRNSSCYHVLDLKKRSKPRPKTDERYFSDRSDSSETFADYGYERYQTRGKLKKEKEKKKKIAVRNRPENSESKATSRESRPNRKQKCRHPVSSLEKASPSKPALADDHSENDESPHSAQSSADKASVLKPKKSSEKMNSKPSAEIQHDVATTDDHKATVANRGNESNEHFSSCALGGRSREPMFWLARGESSSDNESWDFDGPMILPPPPL